MNHLQSDLQLLYAHLRVIDSLGQHLSQVIDRIGAAEDANPCGMTRRVRCDQMDQQKSMSCVDHEPVLVNTKN